MGRNKGDTTFMIATTVTTTISARRLVHVPLRGPIPRYNSQLLRISIPPTPTPLQKHPFVPWTHPPYNECGQKNTYIFLLHLLQAVFSGTSGQVAQKPSG